MANDQKTQNIRQALTQLDPANNAHWTEDGLPREGIIRKLASDDTISRKDITAAQPGFQRNPVAPTPTAGDNIDPLTGSPVVAGEAAKADSVAQKAAADGENDSNDGAHKDPTQNAGDFMTEAEVRETLEGRVKDAIQAVEDAQTAVRAANKAVVDRQAELVEARAEFTREFPPMTAAENIKQYIASEQSQRAAAHGYGGLAPGSQIDAAMQRSNSRGWRRPSRQGVTQSGAARVA